MTDKINFDELVFGVEYEMEHRDKKTGKLKNKFTIIKHYLDRQDKIIDQEEVWEEFEELRYNQENLRGR